MPTWTGDETRTLHRGAHRRMGLPTTPHDQASVAARGDFTSHPALRARRGRRYCAGYPSRINGARGRAVCGAWAVRRGIGRGDADSDRNRACVGTPAENSLRTGAGRDRIATTHEGPRDPLGHWMDQLRGHDRGHRGRDYGHCWRHHGRPGPSQGQQTPRQRPSFQ